MPIQLAVYLLLFTFYFQNPNNTPEARAKVDAQNAELKALLQVTPKLPLDRSPLQLQGYGDDVVAGTVSWVSSDKNGLIYLIQRGDKIDPVVVMDKSANVVRTWGKGMYTMPHAIRVDPDGNVWTTDAASSMVYKFTPEG